MPEPRITAILTTFNRAALLPRVLGALASQTLPREAFELIVVDDGSTDRTPDEVAERGGNLPLRYERQENRGLAAAKNRGIELARAPIVVFLDDDDVAAPDLLERHLLRHERHPEPELAVLGYTDLAPEVAAAPLMRYVTEVGCQLFCYPRLRHGEVYDYTHFWGGRSSAKTAPLRASGGFDPMFRFGCEDIELGYRLKTDGLRVVHDRTARSTMIRTLSLEDLCRRSERQGESNWRFFRKHPTGEIRDWTMVAELEAQWRRTGDRLDRVTAAARRLDEIAAARLRHGVALDAEFTRSLHEHYAAALDGHRVRGSWRVRVEEEGDGPAGRDSSTRFDARSDRLLARMPSLHCWDGVWNRGGFDRSLLAEWLEILGREGLTRPGRRFLETGAGLSTLAFLATDPAEVISVVGPDPELADRIRAAATELDLPTGALRLETSRSELALPRLVLDREPFVDAALIDGGHGWPTVFVDFCYASYALRQGGLLALDDRQLHSVRELIEFLRRQPGWELLAEPGRMAIFRKTYVQRMLPDFGGQPYVLERSRS